MKGKKRDIDPPKKSNPKDAYDYPVYDGRAGYYPNPNYKGSGSGREWRTAENAPKEAGRLRLDPRLSRAAHEVGEDIGASDTRIGRSVNKYLDKSRALVAEKLAKKYGIKSKGNLSEGEKEFIPKLDNVIDKLSGLSDADIKELQSQITKLAKPYVDIDKESSKAKQIAEAISIASDQDWSAIKPIRERAGLTRDDVLSLIQAPEDSDWVEALAYKAARSAASLKEFQNGGTVKRDNKTPTLPKSLRDHFNDPKTVKAANDRMKASLVRPQREAGLNPVYPEFILPAGKVAKSAFKLAKSAPSLGQKISSAIYPAVRSAEAAGDVYEYTSGSLQNGGMIKRKDGSYSKRGLWDNIRKNIGSGKKPTKAMLEAEKKINKK